MRCNDDPVPPNLFIPLPAAAAAAFLNAACMSCPLPIFLAAAKRRNAALKSGKGQEISFLFSFPLKRFFLYPKLRFDLAPFLLLLLSLSLSLIQSSFLKSSFSTEVCFRKNSSLRCYVDVDKEMVVLSSYVTKHHLHVSESIWKGCVIRGPR